MDSIIIIEQQVDPFREVAKDLSVTMGKGYVGDLDESLGHKRADLQKLYGINSTLAKENGTKDVRVNADYVDGTGVLDNSSYKVVDTFAGYATNDLSKIGIENIDITKLTSPDRSGMTDIQRATLSAADDVRQMFLGENLSEEFKVISKIVDRDLNYSLDGTTVMQGKLSTPVGSNTPGYVEKGTAALLLNNRDDLVKSHADIVTKWKDINEKMDVAMKNIDNELNGTNATLDSSKIREAYQAANDIFEGTLAKLKEYSGAGAEKLREAADCVAGKIITTNWNINYGLEPACASTVILAQLVHDYQTGVAVRNRLEEIWQQAKKTLESTSPTKECEHWHDIPAHREGNTWVGGGREQDHDSDPNPAYEAAVKAEAAALAAYNKFCEWMHATYKASDEYKKNINGYIDACKNFNAQSEKILGSTADNFVDMHDEIVKDFNDIEKNPEVTNITWWHKGDTVLHDDGYGHSYRLTREPSLGDDGLYHVYIAMCDENGEPIGPEIEVMDQRELGVLRKMAEKEATPTTPVPVTAPTRSSGGGGYSGGGGGNSNGGSTSPNPTPSPSPVPYPTPTPTPTPIPTPTPSPTPTKSNPTPEPTPTPTPTPTPNNDTPAPHTGLDVLQSNSSLVGIGALAGAIAAGGLGLASKKKENEENAETSEEKKEIDTNNSIESEKIESKESASLLENNQDTNVNTQ